MDRGGAEAQRRRGECEGWGGGERWIKRWEVLGVVGQGAGMLSFNELSHRVIGACIEVHRHLGPGLLESAYEECLCYELSLVKLPFTRQKPLPLFYKGIEMNCSYRLDIEVDDRLVIELKAVERLLPVHEAQLLTYLKLSGHTLGLLVNFNVPILRQGLKRIANNFQDPPPSANPYP